MIDRNSQFMAILTNVGAAKLANANALGIPWNLTALGVGDANGSDPIPSATQTKLINEQRRAPLNQLRVDPVNAAVIIAEQVIPADIGGWWIREIGLYDSDGDLVAVSNCAPSFKPALDQGSGRTQIVRMNFIVSSIANIVLKIDPAVVLATREYVDLAITEAMNKQDFKHSVLVATTTNIVLSGIQTVDGVLLATDARVLVKNQTQAKDNGIYVVPTSGMWKRAQDADASVEVTPGLFVAVEKGTANGDSLWQLVTDAPIILGTTALTFEMVSGRTGVIAGTYRNLTVDKSGRVIAGTNPITLAGYGITDAMPAGAGGLMTVAPRVVGAISDLQTSQFFACDTDTTTDMPPGISLGVGLHIKRAGNSGQYAFDLLSSVTGESFKIRGVFADGPGVYRDLWHSGNFDPSAKANRANTLSGYGITDAYTKEQVAVLVDQSRVGIAGNSRGLIVSSTGLDSKVSIKADQLAVGRADSVQVLSGLSLTLDLAKTGAGGLDSGLVAASTFYHVYVLRGAGDPVAIASLNPIAPQMPAGFTHKARVSCLRTDATTKYPWRFDQDGNRISLKFAAGTNLLEYPLIASGAAGNISTPVWQAISLVNFVPPTASAVLIQLSKPDDSTSAMLAPNPNFGGIASSTTQPPIVINCPTNRADSRMALFPVDSANMNFYYAANSPSPRVRLMGWEERL